VPRTPREGPRRPTIADIAERAGVSKVSVSYALNGNPGLSEATRSRILQVAKEIGWQPNRAARALSAARSGACGLAFARPARTLAYEPFFNKLLAGIEAALSAQDVALMIQIVEDTDAEAAMLRRWWAERRVDGVLLVDLRTDDPRVATVEELKLPAVIIGGPGHTGSLPFFPGNDAGGMHLIVEHLTSLGHRRIDRVAGSANFAAVQVRSRIFKRLLTRAGAVGRVVGADFTSLGGEAATRKLLELAEPPTAVVYDNDIMAVAGLGVAQEMGARVPEDLSIVSFEDSILCEVVRPSVTATVRDVEAFGAVAARALIEVIEGREVTPHGPQTSSLVARRSSSRPGR